MLSPIIIHLLNENNRFAISDLKINTVHRTKMPKTLTKCEIHLASIRHFRLTILNFKNLTSNS